MQRHAIKRLLEWKVSSSRKPLLIRGARQVGKTWLMKEFGKREYERCCYINFENNKLLKASGIFEEFKVVLCEQFVFQQFVSALGLNPFYWSSEKSTAEIDFIIQYQDKLISVEVKAGENLQAKN